MLVAGNERWGKCDTAKQMFALLKEEQRWNMNVSRSVRLRHKRATYSKEERIRNGNTRINTKMGQNKAKDLTFDYSFFSEY